MKVKAKANYLRIAPRKIRLVADLIRKKKVEEAQAILRFAIKKGSQPLLKLLNSAMASAKNDFHLDPANFYIFSITIDEGPKYKRWMPRARGSAYPIQKKTSKATLVLEELVPGKKVKKSKKKVAESTPASEAKEIKKPEKEKEKFEIKKYLERPKPSSPTGGAKGLKRFFMRKSV